MNKAWTSYPCSLSSRAETDESTPPDNPTNTFFLLIFVELTLLTN